MNEIHLSPKKLIELMSDREKVIGQGTYGIIIPYDEETIIKIYYKEIYDGFYYLDEANLLKKSIQISQFVMQWRNIIPII